jgi:ubiquinone/menaquinone biosynthesis C-methylase UbiE
MNGRTVSQAMHPSGIRGRLFAKLMEWLNTPAYQRAVALIDPAPGDTVLEIGFGSGALLLMLAPHLSGGLLAGIDPSALMVQLARERLKRHRPPVRLDLRQGSDREIDWPVGYFSHVAALHSFQFWSEPHATLRKIKNVLRPDGQLTLILRSHSRRRPEWLPNAISRSEDEITGTLDALESAGYDHLTRSANVGSSAVITATVSKRCKS